MAEFEITIKCGECGSANCEEKEDYWEDGSLYKRYYACNDCGENDY